MVYGTELFFSLFNNLAIFIALVAVYAHLLSQFKQSIWIRRQTMLGLSFGVFAISCMYAKIQVFEGVIVDQRNAIITLGGAFGGPFAAITSALLAGIYRIHLGGGGAFAGIVGVSLAAVAGIILNRFSKSFSSVQKAAASALFATILILPGFLFVKDLHTGFELMKAMALPYGLAIFFGIFLAGLLLNKEEEKYDLEISFETSKEKYHQLIEGTEDLITHTDKHGNLTFINNVAEKILGVTPEKCIGMSAFSFIHPDDRERTIELYNKCAARQQSQMKIENRQVNHRTGESRTLLWSSSLHYDESGSLKGVGGIARDVTERKRAEDALNQSETYLKTLIHAIPDLVWLKDENGVFLFCNSKFESLYSATEKEIIGKTDYDFVDKELADFFREHDKLAMAKKGPSINEEKVTYAANGHHEILETIKVPIYDKQKQLIGVLGIARDITERKKFKSRLQQAQKMEAIGTLAGGIAHDFNNILSPLVGYSEILIDEIPKDSPLQKHVQQILKAAFRAKDLVQQILAFSKQTDPKNKPVQFQSILKEALKLIRSSIPKTIDIQTEIEPEGCVVMADPTQLHQIIMNLATNAFHAMQESGGRLKVTLKQVKMEPDLLGFSDLSPGDYALLKFMDTGKGIKKKLMDKIFNPYFTTKEVGKGTGIGLSIVQGIIKNYNGEIYIYSEPDQGTEVHVYLPIIKKDIEISEEDNLEPIQGGSERILLVDDEAAIAKMEKHTLERLGYKVTSLTDSIKALETFKNNPDQFDLIISDMTMPKMTGLMLADKIKAIRPSIPFIICSGFSEQIDEETSGDMGIQAYIAKPVIKRKMAKVIRNLLDTKE